MPSFNPTLVRLRHIRHSTTRGRQASFQSHLGSIAAALGSARPERPRCFQSHLGSIAAGEVRLRAVCFPEPFNPTLVRLRHDSEHHSEHRFGPFNPTLVRLRRKETQRKMRPDDPFNPTLVRLRQVHWTGRLLPHSTFNPTVVRLRHSPLSPAALRPNSLSIPPWFDCGADNDCCPLQGMRLSIPPWFDCGGLEAGIES